MRISDWSSDVCSSDLIGKAAAEQPGEGDAKGELVGLLIAPVPLVNLGSHIARRTWNIDSGRVFDARQPRHAEIDQPQPAVLGDDDVFRLYVAMADPQPVPRDARAGELNGDLHSPDRKSVSWGKRGSLSVDIGRR